MAFVEWNTRHRAGAFLVAVGAASPLPLFADGGCEPSDPRTYNDCCYDENPEYRQLYCPTRKSNRKGKIQAVPEVSSVTVDGLTVPGALRGELVTMDGSRSRPSTGRTIQSYEWRIVPTGCPEFGEPAILSGVRVRFSIICQVTAHLTVRDGAQSDTRAVVAQAAPRKWKTDLKIIPMKTPLPLREDGYLVHGINICALHHDWTDDAWSRQSTGTEPTIREGAGHYYHRAKPSEKRTYENGTFTLAQVTGAGPFSGVWYVDRFDGRMPRWVVVNKRLYPGGDVYLLNEKKGNLANLNLFRKATELHELAHAFLLKKDLSRINDPALSVECGIGLDRETLAADTNSVLAQAEERFFEHATSELRANAAVKKKFPELDRRGVIYYPRSAGGVFERWHDFLDTTYHDPGEVVVESNYDPPACTR